MHKSHMHPNHFQTVENKLFLIVKKVFFYPNLVTNGNIRHVVFFVVEDWHSSTFLLVLTFIVLFYHVGLQYKYNVELEEWLWCEENHQAEVQV